MTFIIFEIQRLQATEVNSLNVTKEGHGQKLKPQCHAFCPLHVAPTHQPTHKTSREPIITRTALSGGMKSLYMEEGSGNTAARHDPHKR